MVIISLNIYLIIWLGELHMYNELVAELDTRGASLIKVIDISQLSKKENRGYNIAIVIGIVLSPGYIFRQSIENIIDHSEFGEKEHLADELAEWIADFLIAKGYRAFAQSERNLIDGCYNEKTKTTLLPHKSYIGWIRLDWEK